MEARGCEAGQGLGKVLLGTGEAVDEEHGTPACPGLQNVHRPSLHETIGRPRIGRTPRPNHLT